MDPSWCWHPLMPRRETAAAVTDTASKVLLLETILERASGEIGDFNAATMDHFYRLHPAARASFEAHALGNRGRLEASMVNSALYCLMHWLERPMEIRLIFNDQLPHHCETLHVDKAWFAGLVEALTDVLASTVPETEPAQMMLCAELRTGLCNAIATAGKDLRRHR